MAKSNRERINELKTALEEIQRQANEVAEKINSSRTFIDEISQHKSNSEQWRNEVETAKNQSTTAYNEIENLKKEITETREEFNEKLNTVEVKKEDIDKFFIKIFGEEDEQGKRSGGLSARLKRKEKEADTFLNAQEKRYNKLFEKIESLLPSAASTGLAKAYYDQRISYK